MRFSRRICPMRAPLYQVDAFTTRRFAGNPAAVVLLDQYPEDAHLQAIAAENNLSETAFVVPSGDDFQLRWFTPAVEVPLCGHATLASAAVLMERIHPERSSVVFRSASGALPVRRSKTGYILNFPARPSTPIDPPAALSSALGAAPVEVRLNEFNYLAIFADAAQVRALTPDMAAIARMDRPGVIASASGDAGHDIVSRYFAPTKGIPEDPVTGAAHCTLAPYWCQKLGKTELRAHQASSRGGDLLCRLAGTRVELEGSCVFYLEGELEY
jgi:PhzF family phenazine biosynthesis protein